MSRASDKPSDGSGREPRPEQVSAYIDIKSKLLEHEVVCANLPVGLGKSFLARALQREMGGDIITSDNALIAQYLKDYPELNAVMGKDRYDTAEQYHDAHKRAKSGHPSIFNPLSYHFARQRGLRSPELVIVDESHLLNDMLTYLSAHVIPIARTQVPENAKHEGDLIKWCYSRYERLKQAISTPAADSKLFAEFERIARLRDTLEEGTQNQVFEISKAMIPYSGSRPQKCLVLTPVRVPHSLIRAVTGARRVLAVSGTMSRYDSEHLAAGRDMGYIQMPYIAPAESRPVYFNPVDPDLRKDPQALANKILEIYHANPVPTLVHVTYGMQAQLAEALSHLNPLVNNTRNKAQVKKEFLKRKGIWLGAGVSEGLDLPHDACRQVIVPVLLYPDRTDLFVQKRAGLHDGDMWYKVRTTQNTIQRLGRGHRAADDYCVSHILDPTWARLYPQVSDQFAALNMIWTVK